MQYYLLYLPPHGWADEAVGAARHGASRNPRRPERNTMRQIQYRLLHLRRTAAVFQDRSYLQQTPVVDVGKALHPAESTGPGEVSCRMSQKALAAWLTAGSSGMECSRLGTPVNPSMETLKFKTTFLKTNQHFVMLFLFIY